MSEEAFQLRVATVALSATMPRGFALAGSGAIRAHGFTTRRTADIDLFTPFADPVSFADAVEELTAQLVGDGYSVSLTRRFELFARLEVSAAGQLVDVDLGVDPRGREPVVLAVGAVLAEIDAVANKVIALFGRAEARDFLDVDAIRRSRRFTDGDLLDAAAERDAGFDRGVFVEMLRSVRRIGPRRVAEYDVTADELAAVQERLSSWADEIEQSLGERD
jgi:hypothetical protein